MKLEKIDIFQRLRVSRISVWYREKQGIDRAVINLLLVTTGLMFLWMGVWRPVTEWQAFEQERYSQAQRTLFWIEEQENKARDIVKRNKEEGEQVPIIQAITSTASTVGIALDRIQPESNQIVSVAMEEQDFNSILIWLDSLGKQHNISIASLTIVADGDGKVNFQGRLRR